MFDKKAVHFGSGAIGRGFVGEFLHRSNYSLVFVDVADQIIDALNAAGSYTVTQISARGTESHSTVDNFRAFNSKTEAAAVVSEISTADLVTCAVGPNILKFIAPLIADGINARSKSLGPAGVIACENAINATDTLARFIRSNLSEDVTQDEASVVRFANSAVDRIVPQQTSTSPTVSSPDSPHPNHVSLDVRIEEYAEWCVEYPPFGPSPADAPQIKNVHYVKDLGPYIERKLFTVNTGHATAAYLGHLASKPLIHQAMADRGIAAAVRATLGETASLICVKHGIKMEDQTAYADSIVARISNPALEDEVIRVGRAPLRKLSRNERLIGPACQLADRGMRFDHLLSAIEAAFRFVDVVDDSESVELGRILRATPDDPREVVLKVCGLKKGDSALYDRLVEVVGKVQRDLASQSSGKSTGRLSVKKAIMAEM